jgi:hypothetical protein
MAPRAEVVERKTLGDADIASMFAVFKTVYDNVSLDRFKTDLAEKEWIVLLRDDDRVAGFTTARILKVGGEKAVFSGDTVVDPAHWDSLELPRAWGRFVMSMEPVWWFLISKGVRTYLYLPLYFREFWPRHDQPMPADVRERLDTFARAKYPKEYDAGRGLIEFAKPHGNLKPAFAEVPAHRADDAHVRYFLERNPNYRKGTELACLARVSRNNLTPAAVRVLRGG